MIGPRGLGASMCGQQDCRGEDCAGSEHDPASQVIREAHFRLLGFAARLACCRWFVKLDLRSSRLTRGSAAPVFGANREAPQTEPSALYGVFIVKRFQSGDLSFLLS